MGTTSETKRTGPKHAKHCACGHSRAAHAGGGSGECQRMSGEMNVKGNGLSCACRRFSSALAAAEGR